MDKPKYKRVLLKLSGEALAGDRGIGINNEVVNEIAVAIKKVREQPFSAILILVSLLMRVTIIPDKEGCFIFLVF